MEAEVKINETNILFTGEINSFLQDAQGRNIVKTCLTVLNKRNLNS